MSAIIKILLARDLLLDLLKLDISSHSLNKRGKELKITLLNGISLYIVFNDFNQYSYTIQYSQSKLNRIRFDNFDDHWNVPSNPHHCHIQNSKDVVSSPMEGNPGSDIPKLVDYIKQ